MRFLVFDFGVCCRCPVLASDERCYQPTQYRFGTSDIRSLLTVAPYRARVPCYSALYAIRYAH
eukprot:2476932-Rhodomonas_salina.1